MVDALTSAGQDAGPRTTVLISAIRAKAGGGITYLSNILPCLASDPRLDVHVCLQPDQRELYEQVLNGITVHELTLPAARWRDLWFEQKEIPRLAREIGASVTYSPANFGPLRAPGLVILLRNALGVGLLDRRPAKIAYWVSLWFMTAMSVFAAARVISVSNFAISAASGGIARLFMKKLTVIHHGRSERFVPPRQKPETGKGGTRLLTVSDIYVQKNLLTLVRALSRIAEEEPGVTLRIAGTTIDATYRERVDAEIEALGLRDRVKWLGRLGVDDLVAVMYDADIFVFPSYVETFGNPLIEAMGCGMPVASSNSAAMPEIAADGAVYFDPADPANMAMTILDLMRDPVRREELARRAAARADAFSWERCARETADTLLQAAGRPV